MAWKKYTLVTLAALLLVLTAVIVSGCMSSTATAPAGDIKKFSSAEEIQEYIKNNTQLAQDSYYATDGVWATGSRCGCTGNGSRVLRKGCSPHGCSPVCR